MTSPSWRVFNDPDAFHVALGSTLLEREVENCLPLAICWKISRGTGQEREAFMYLSEAGGGDCRCGCTHSGQERSALQRSDLA